MSHEPAPGAGQPSGHRSSCGHGHGWRPTEKALPLWDGAVSSGRGLPVKSGPARRAPGPGSGMAPRGTKPHQNPEAPRRRCMSCRGHAAVTMQLAIARPLETGQDAPRCEDTEPPGDTATPAATLLLKRSRTDDHQDRRACGQQPEAGRRPSSAGRTTPAGQRKGPSRRAPPAPFLNFGLKARGDQGLLYRTAQRVPIGNVQNGLGAGDT